MTKKEKKRDFFKLGLVRPLSFNSSPTEVNLFTFFIASETLVGQKYQAKMYIGLKKRQQRSHQAKNAKSFSD
jgi:hypothetical protein